MEAHSTTRKVIFVGLVTTWLLFLEIAKQPLEVH